MSLLTLILIIVFAAIVIRVFANKRKARFDQNAKIPFDDGKS